MNELSIDTIFQKIQYCSILNALYKYPEGLTLHELTYLLTTKKNMQKMSILRNRFNSQYPHEIKEKRKDIFKGKVPRSRIHRCLNELSRNFGLIEKFDKKYKLAKKTSEIFSLILNINYFNFLFERSKTAKFYFEIWKEQQPKMKSFDLDKVDKDFTSLLLTPNIQIYGHPSALSYKDKEKFQRIVDNLFDNSEQLQTIAGKKGNITVVINTHVEEVRRLIYPKLYIV